MGHPPVVLKRNSLKTHEYLSYNNRIHYYSQTIKGSVVNVGNLKFEDITNEL